MPKFFFVSQAVNGTTVTLDGKDFLHMSKSLRLAPGEAVTLCDENGVDYRCAVREINKTGAVLDIVERTVCPNEPSTRVTLFQGLPKGDKMELIIQKCVELGVYEIVPVITERTIARPDGDKIEKRIARYNKIAEEAAKQSLRGIIPRVGALTDLKGAAAHYETLDCAFVAFENEHTLGLKTLLKQPPYSSAQSLGVFIGPEGGFALSEIEFLTARGIRPVSLGKRILRTETAGIVALIAALYERDEL